VVNAVTSQAIGDSLVGLKQVSARSNKASSRARQSSGSFR